MKVSFVIIVSAALCLARSQGADEFSLVAFTVDGGGGGPQTGGEFSLAGTFGQPDSCPAIAAGQFTLEGGFWPFDWPMPPPPPPALTLHVVLTTSGRIEISAQGAPGMTATVEANADLGDPKGWLTLGNVTADAGGLMTFVSIDNPTYPMRFYRFVSTTNPQ